MRKNGWLRGKVGLHVVEIRGSLVVSGDYVA
jgi:hypothetical protein